MSMRSALGAALLAAAVLLGPVSGAGAACDPGVELVISEFMAANDRTLADEDGDYSDWIEIYNPCLATVSLAGWSLTDDPDELTKWRFPAISLARGEFLVVFASGKNRAVAGAPLHTSFKLDAGGEYLALVKPDGTTIAQAVRARVPGPGLRHVLRLRSVRGAAAGPGRSRLVPRPGAGRRRSRRRLGGARLRRRDVADRADRARVRRRRRDRIQRHLLQGQDSR